MKKLILIILALIVIALLPVIVNLPKYISITPEIITQVCTKQGIMKENRLIIPYDYDSITPTQNNLFIGEKAWYKGVINEKGETVIPFEYSRIDCLDNGCFLAMNDIKKREFSSVFRKNLFYMATLYLIKSDTGFYNISIGNFLQTNAAYALFDRKGNFITKDDKKIKEYTKKHKIKNKPGKSDYEIVRQLNYLYFWTK